jgi:hypothetical protein
MPFDIWLVGLQHLALLRHWILLSVAALLVAFDL